MDDKTRLDYYKKSLQSAWGYNDYNDWPIKVNSIMHLFLTEFAAEFLEDIREAKEKKKTTSDIAKAFGNPARFYRIIDPVIFGMKRLKINIADQRKIVLELLDIVKNMKYGSEFNEDGINLILSPDRITAVLQRNPLKPADQSTASLIQRFCGIAWAYTESIFFRAHEVTKEVHGPYLLNCTNEKLIVREYLHLNPTEIWKDIAEVPYENIVIYTKYKNSLDVTIDSYNHLFLHGGNYVSDLLEYGIEIDGVVADVDELMKIVPAMQKTIQGIHEWVGKADWHTRAKRYADIYWYRKSPLRKLIGKDWRVPPEIYEKIQNGSADPKRLEKLSDEAIERLISIVI